MTTGPVPPPRPLLRVPAQAGEHDGALLRLSEVAARCRVSLRTVQAWVAEKRLRTLHLSPRTVRVTEEALAEFLDRARGEAS